MTTQPKREPLKVGDRVRVKGQPICASFDVVTLEGDPATVTGFTADGFVRVKTDNDYGHEPVFHPRQLVRLRPRQRREFWIPKVPSDWSVKDLEWLMAEPPERSRHLFIHVVEVRSGRKTGGSSG